MLFDLNYIRNFPAENPFLIFSTVSQNIYTYKDVLQRVECLLKEFRNVHIPKKCGIAIKLKNQHVTPTGCVLLLGILNYDCYFCPINNVQDIASHGIEASYVLTDDRSDIGLSETTYITSLNVFEDEGEVFLMKLCEVKVSQDAKWCYCISTTGSTGQPKIVYVPYESIAANIRSLSLKFKITTKDVIFLAAPVTFDPFVIEFFMALFNGASLLLTTKAMRQTPSQLLDILFPSGESLVGATVLQMTPSLFRSFGVDAVRDVIFNVKSSLRILVLGGEPFPQVKELKSWLPKGPTEKKIFNIYGITEISCWSLISEVDLFTCSGDVEIPLGHGIEADTKVEILHKSGEFLKGAGVGELLLGSSTRKCFIPQVDSNANFDEGTLYRHTGDLVERYENGNLYYRGRLNNTIKRFGKRVSLEGLSLKIENFLSTKAVCLWSDTRKKLICCLAYCDSACILEISRLIMGKSLMSHEKPDLIIHRDDFPLNRHGKVDRHKLLEIVERHNMLLKPLEVFHKFLKESLGVQGEIPNETEGVAQPLQKKRKSIWDSSFVSVGGTSYQALSLSLEIGELLVKSEDQRKFLELLLQPDKTLRSINEFLTNAPLKPSKVEHIEQFPKFTKQFHFCWRQDFGKCVDSTPTLVSNKFVCVGAHSHSLRTLDSISGEEEMHLKLPDRVECTVEFAREDKNLAFVGCYDGRLYAFDFVAGTVKWHVDVGGMIKAKPMYLPTEQSLIVACYGEAFNIWCLSLKVGNVKWRLKLGSKGIFASPIHSSLRQCVFVCSLDGSVACLEPMGGLQKWKQSLNSPIFSTPALTREDSLLVVAEVNGNVHICSALHGEIMHTLTADGNIFSSITVHGSKLIFGCHDHNVYCVNVTQANQLEFAWRTCVKAAVYATPSLVYLNDETFIVAISTKGQLTLIDEVTGHVTASYEVGGEVFSSPCCYMGDDRVYFGCRDNFLYCFRVG